MTVAWDDGGERRPAGVRCKILRLRPGGTSQAFLVGPPLAVWLHWVEKSAVPHLQQHCPHCTVSRKFRRWYAPAVAPIELRGHSQRQWHPVILELNGDCIDALIDQNCNGLKVELRRPSGNRSPLELRLCAQPKDWPVRFFDVRPILESIWGVAEGEIPAGTEEAPDTLPFPGGKTA